METEKNRVVLELDLPMRRRLAIAAAFKGISVKQYCQRAIDRELTRDEVDGAVILTDKPDHESFAELRQEIFRGKPLPGNSVDLLREAREIRSAEMDGW